MPNLHLPASSATPAIDFNFATHQLSIRGESYPENAQAYFEPILTAIRQYLGTAPKHVTLDVQLAYFNSSSTKLFLEMFGLFNDAAIQGSQVTLNWHYDEDDDTILEFGEEVADDFPSLDFNSMALQS